MIRGIDPPISSFVKNTHVLCTNISLLSSSNFMHVTVWFTHAFGNEERVQVYKSTDLKTNNKNNLTKGCHYFV